MPRVVQAGKFKAECLRLMDEVSRSEKSIIITKRGVPVAQLVPIAGKPRELFGYLEGSVKTKGDIVSPIGEEWNACS